jgi:LysM repeat protein
MGRNHLETFCTVVLATHFLNLSHRRGLIMPQKTQPSIVLLMIGMAIILAAGLFLAVSAIRNRPETPASDTAVLPNVEVVNVGGQQITLRRDPNQKVTLLNPANAAQPESVPQETRSEQPPATETPPPPAEQPPPVDQPAVPAPTDTPITVPTDTPQVIFIDYDVGQNDTLYSIAIRIDTSIALMAVHGIAQDHLIPGTRIRLPVGNPNYCPGLRPYAVGEGDTAFNIGQRFGITAAELRSMNDLDENFTVRVAEILCVP